MSKYISVDAFKALVLENANEREGSIAMRLIDRVPAADVVDVVRCRDCQFCMENFPSAVSGITAGCCFWDYGVFLNGWCSHGKKKEAEE